ncbi:uncharacterized protein A1O9_02780 [Exophiala aquamarina CBS 119918]|uniref:Myb-like DNA-binding domain-containing protein n=1 Tax=Exophiala aquamarina CBS 119918 TaxID=1182545 RepID=A0A072PZZ6_9EURO|nr:uncharacterized protein A1O9_02780 [Exophiala aquamarina CBS 119918]KEF61215.1 hypothetical protein A1O9_02780 [Exophiala aquamarina CBS 119918]
MPPKTANLEEGDPTFKFVFSVLKHCEQVKPAWENVAKENGFGYARNAQAKFKGIVEKHGFKLEGGRIMGPGEDDVATPAGKIAGSTSVKTPKTPKTPKSAATAGKRKASEMTGDVAAETPTKSAAKKKKAAPEREVKVEDGGDDDATNGAARVTASYPKKKSVAATTYGLAIKKDQGAGDLSGLGLDVKTEEQDED